jgi:hypothetical protein
MAAKFTRLTHKIAIQLHPVAENSTTICSSRSMRPVRKLLDIPSYTLMGSPSKCLIPLTFETDFYETWYEHRNTRGHFHRFTS